MLDVARRCPETFRIAGSALVASLLFGVDGGPDAGAAEAHAPPTTAYAKTRNTVALEGKTFGPMRSIAEASLQQCNGLRAFYPGLAPVRPSEAVLAQLDVSIVEKYIASDKALTAITRQFPTLPDVKRWTDEYAVSARAGQLPATPPNCSLVLMEQRRATLWRDGKVHDLRFTEKKAVAIAISPAPVTDRLAELYAKAPTVEVVGQSCRDIVDPTGLSPGSHSCVWDIFPYVNRLNWPFVLSGKGRFGPVPGQVETIEPIEARAGQPIENSVFDIPF